MGQDASMYRVTSPSHSAMPSYGKVSLSVTFPRSSWVNADRQKQAVRMFRLTLCFLTSETSRFASKSDRI